MRQNKLRKVIETGEIRRDLRQGGYAFVGEGQSRTKRSSFQVFFHDFFDFARHSKNAFELNLYFIFFEE